MFGDLFPNGAWHYLLGGLLIGCGVSVLFVTTGLIGGASTFYSATCSFFSKRPFFQQPRLVQSRDWRLVYAAGMVLGAAVVALLSHGMTTEVPWWQLLLGGFVGGFGARLANGCTSGHGICGLASLQLPSLFAVLTFLATAFLSARVVLAIGGR